MFYINIQEALGGIHANSHATDTVFSLEDLRSWLLFWMYCEDLLSFFQVMLDPTI